MQLFLVLLAAMLHAAATSAGVLNRRATTSSTSTTKTSTATASPSSTSSIKTTCGLPGFHSALPFLSTYNGETYNDCLLDCKANPKCKSISFATDRSFCDLYSVKATSVAKYDVTSPWHFYDADCNTAYKVCNVAARDFQFQPYWDGTGYTADTCASACVDDDQCRSFSYGNGGECHFYFVPVTGNIDTTTGSPYTFSDVTCVPGCDN